MEKIYEWITKHKVRTVIICVVVFALPLVFVHLLYMPREISWVITDWGSGDILSYIAGFEAFLGTVFLGLVSLEQNRKAEQTNERLSKENNYLQKISSQKLLPIVKLRASKTIPTVKNNVIPDPFPSVSKFTRTLLYNLEFPDRETYKITVNIDVEEGIPAYQKTLTFSIRNVSESFIRHICVDDISICGYKDAFSEIRCSNEKPGNGISSLFTVDDSLTVQANFYFNSDKIKSCWDSDSGGLAVTMFLTNTTIAGIKFHEFMSINLTDNGYSHVSYGERSYDEEEEEKENNA